MEEELTDIAITAASYLLGVSMDPRLPDDTREALASKYKEIIGAIEKAQCE